VERLSLALFHGALGGVSTRPSALPFALLFLGDGDFLGDMDFPKRGRLPHEVPSWVAPGSFYFITINCEPRGRNQLARGDRADTVFAATVFNHKKCVWFCRLMLLMPDHLHAIIAFPGNRPEIKRTITNWKHFLATHHSIEWQRDFFDRRLRNEGMRSKGRVIS
jgi:putative transposase